MLENRRGVPPRKNIAGEPPFRNHQFLEDIKNGAEQREKYTQAIKGKSHKRTWRCFPKKTKKPLLVTKKRTCWMAEEQLRRCGDKNKYFDCSKSDQRHKKGSLKRRKIIQRKARRKHANNNWPRGWNFDRRHFHFGGFRVVGGIKDESEMKWFWYSRRFPADILLITCLIESI